MHIRKFIFIVIASFSSFLSSSQNSNYRDRTEDYYKTLFDYYSKEHETMNTFVDIQDDVLTITSEMRIPTKIEKHTIGPGTISGAKHSFYGILDYILLGTEEDREIYQKNHFRKVRLLSTLIDQYYNRMVIEMSVDGAYLLNFPLPEYKFIQEIKIDRTYFDLN